MQALLWLEWIIIAIALRYQRKIADLYHIYIHLKYPLYSDFYHLVFGFGFGFVLGFG
jgi:hypothetical protein